MAEYKMRKPKKPYTLKKKKKSEPPNRSKTPTQGRKDSLYGITTRKEREGMRDLVEKGEPPSNRKRAQKQQNQDRLRDKPLRGEKSMDALIATRNRGEPPARGRTRKFRVKSRGR